MFIEFGLKEDDMKQKREIERIIRPSDKDYSFIIIKMKKQIKYVPIMPLYFKNYVLHFYFFSINKSVNPACLWRNTTHTPFLLYSVSGKNDERPIFSIPRFNDDCRSEVKGSNLLDDEVCITNSDGDDDKDKCKNQGELILSDFEDENKNTLTYLVAVYKRGDGCKDPLIYNRFSHFANLIKIYAEADLRI